MAMLILIRCTRSLLSSLTFRFVRNLIAQGSSKSCSIFKEPSYHLPFFSKGQDPIFFFEPLRNAGITRQNRAWMTLHREYLAEWHEI